MLKYLSAAALTTLLSMIGALGLLGVFCDEQCFFLVCGGSCGVGLSADKPFSCATTFGLDALQVSVCLVLSCTGVVGHGDGEAGP